MPREGAVLPPSRLRARRRKRRALIALSIVAFLILICAGIAALLHIQGIRVREVHVSGVQTLSADEVSAEIQKELSGSYLWVIPKNSTLVYSGGKLEAAVLHAFPKLKTASVSLDTFHGITVEVTERAPADLWCGDVVDDVAESNPTCAFMDEHGLVYEEAPRYSGDAYIRWYGALDTPDLPATFTTPDTFHALRPLVDSLKNEKEHPERVFVDANGDVFVDFIEGFEIRFALTEKPQDVVVALKTARDSSALKGKDLSSLQYLDLRFGDRLYYKFK